MIPFCFTSLHFASLCSLSKGNAWIYFFLLPIFPYTSSQYFFSSMYILYIHFFCVCWIQNFIFFGLILHHTFACNLWLINDCFLYSLCALCKASLCFLLHLIAIQQAVSGNSPSASSCCNEICGLKGYVQKKKTFEYNSIHFWEIVWIFWKFQKFSNILIIEVKKNNNYDD